MKINFIKYFLFTLLINCVISNIANAQGMMYWNTSTTSIDNTSKEEAQGKAIWESLQVKTKNCRDLSDDDYELLGEYSMGLIAGNSHQSMNQMMTNMMGESGERQMHIALGKRSSGCDINAIDNSDGFFMPMMGMMFGGWSASNANNQFNNPMMWNYGYPMFWGGFGPIFMIIFWILIIVGIVYFVRWAVSQSKGGNNKQNKTPLDILKERYAKGEINKQEFEEKKKDLL